MNTKPSRFGMRFSLRALIVIVTLICLWLGWETSVIRERRRLREEAAKEGVFHFQLAELNDQRPVPFKRAKISPVRRMLGDQAVQSVWYWDSLPVGSQPKLEQLKRAFPEASFSHSLPEPCHPGCFPAGTLVETASGSRRIESIAAGEEVLIVLPNGSAGTAAVQTVFVTQNILWHVETADDLLITTQTQPLCLADGTTRQAGELVAGDVIRRWQDGAVRETAVLSVATTRRTAKVFNLILGDKQLFVANGFVARSKPPVDP